MRITVGVERRLWLEADGNPVVVKIEGENENAVDGVHALITDAVGENRRNVGVGLGAGCVWEQPPRCRDTG